MAYIEVCIHFRTGHFEKWYDHFIADLLLMNFEGFRESDDKLFCYIPSDQFSSKKFESLVKKWKAQNAFFSCSVLTIEDKNWNEIWESSYHPVIVGDKCQILAPFHDKDPSIPIHIVLEPKMAFGTGHHETTFLMIEEILTHSIKGKNILDVGCGTGILSILSARLGAAHVLAVDNNRIAVNSCRENLKKNQIKGIKVIHGTIHSVKYKKIDFMLANINKRIILNEVFEHSHILNEKGNLILSGFYTEDIKDIETKAGLYHYELVDKRNKNNWAITRFIKKPDG